MPQLDLSKLPDQPKLDLSKLPDKTPEQPIVETSAVLEKPVQRAQPQPPAPSEYTGAFTGSHPFVELFPRKREVEVDPHQFSFIPGQQTDAVFDRLREKAANTGSYWKGFGGSLASDTGRMVTEAVNDPFAAAGSIFKLGTRGAKAGAKPIEDVIAEAPKTFKPKPKITVRGGKYFNELGQELDETGNPLMGGASVQNARLNPQTGEMVIPGQPSVAAAATPTPPTVRSNPVLPQGLKGAKPRYNIGKVSYTPEFESDLDKALFIIAQTKRSPADDQYLKFVMNHTGLDEAKARELGKNVRKQIGQHVKGQPEGVIKVPTIHQLEPELPPLTAPAPAPVAPEYVPGTPPRQTVWTNGPARTNPVTGEAAPPVPPTEVPVTNTGGIGGPPDKPPIAGVDFGNPFTNVSKSPAEVPLWHKIAGAFKGFRASSDLAPLLRQGKNYAGRPAWFRAFKDQTISYLSQAGYQKHLDEIANFGIMKKGVDGKGVSWAEKAGLNITKVNSALEDAEEGIMGGDFAAELLDKARIGKFVNPIRASNRAYTAAMNRLRTEVGQDLYDRYKGMYESLKKTAKTKAELDDAEFFNPDNTLVAQKIGADINTATGRGSLKTDPIRINGKLITQGMDLEKNAVGMNLIGFSPRYATSQIGTIKRIVSSLSPYNYAKIDPIQRKEYWKQLLSIASVMGTSSSIYGLAGAKFGHDPTSSDLGKSRFGENVTVDNSGGLGKYFTLPGQLIAQGTTSGRTGKFSKFGDYGKRDGLDLVEDFLEGMGSPVAGLAMDLLRSEEFGGRPLNLTSMNPWENTITRDLIVPMITQDIYDIIQEDPRYLPLIGPALFGQAINVTEKKSQFGFGN